MLPEENPPLLSIYVPTFNRAKKLDLLLRALRSSLEGYRGHDRVEIILSDNGSVDDTPAICRQNRDLIRHYRSDENLGFDQNFWLALTRCSGKFVWTLGDDDLIESDAISQVMALLDFYAQREEVALIKLPFLRIDDEYEIVGLSPYPSTTKQLSPEEAVHVVGPAELMRMSTSIYRREALATGLFLRKSADHGIAPLEFALIALLSGDLLVVEGPKVFCNEGKSHNRWQSRWPFIANVAMPLLLFRFSRKFKPRRIDRAHLRFFRKGYSVEQLKVAFTSVSSTDRWVVLVRILVDIRFYLAIKNGLLGGER